MFTTKPQLPGALLDYAHAAGIRTTFLADDEVYGGRQLRRGIRQRGMGYVLAVRANHAGDHRLRPRVDRRSGRRDDPGSRVASDAYRVCGSHRGRDEIAVMHSTGTGKRHTGCLIAKR